MRDKLYLNGICPYYTMFPLQFPLDHLHDIAPGSWVFDPFCGRGTTAFAARILGLSSVGTDVNPVAIAISKAKMAKSTPSRIVNLAERILSTVPAEKRPPGRFWELAYSEATLEKILKLKAGLRGTDNNTANALKGIVLGCLHGPRPKTKDSYFSNQMQRTFAPKPDYAVRFWESRQLVPHDIDVLELIREKAIRFYSEEIPKTQNKVILSDARESRIVRTKFSATVTSPPYFGMDTYVPDQWIRNWFLGGPPRPDYSKQQQLSFGTTDQFVTSLSEVWSKVAKHSLPGAKLVIRFGALSSRKSCPEEIVRNSLSRCSATWKLESITEAGLPSRNSRQAEQMGAKARKNSAIEELDFVCRLH